MVNSGGEVGRGWGLLKEDFEIMSVKLCWEIEAYGRNVERIRGNRCEGKENQLDQRNMELESSFSYTCQEFSSPGLRSQVD